MSAPTPSFRVTFLPVVLHRLAAWGGVAKRLGLTADYLDATRELRDRLEADPTGYGDPLRDLRGMDAVAHQALRRYFVVSYVVHRKQPEVLVQHIPLSPYSPLRGG